MNNSTISIGIDNREGTYYAARVDRQTGRPEVKALLRFDVDHFNGHHLLEGGDIILAVPDTEVMIKKIVFPETEKQKEKILFEMSQSLLDNSEDFLFDTIKTRVKDTFLGLVLRKAYFEEIQLPFVKQNGDNTVSVRGMMRAQALVNGFLAFCSDIGSELGVIFDINNKTASAAFYYEKKIIDLISFSTVKYDLSTETSLKSLAVELQMILNFKKAAFFDQGISLPLSTVYMLGEELEDTRLGRLSELMKISIKRPLINHGYLATGKEPPDIPLEKYLVALGLTVY